MSKSPLPRALKAAGALALTGGFTLMFGLGSQVAQADQSPANSQAARSPVTNGESPHLVNVRLKWEHLLGANTADRRVLPEPGRPRLRRHLDRRRLPGQRMRLRRAPLERVDHPRVAQVH